MTTQSNQVTIQRRRDVAKGLSVSLATLDRMVAAGRLPPASRLSSMAVGWPSTVIHQLIENLANPQN